MDSLKKSIKHWEDNLKIAKKELGKYIFEDSHVIFKLGNHLFSMNGSDCALCGEYAEDCCLDCPVHKKTGRNDCLDTPYHELIDYIYENQPAKVTKKMVGLVNKEVKFLKSLVPKKKKSTAKKKRVKKGK